MRLKQMTLLNLSSKSSVSKEFNLPFFYNMTSLKWNQSHWAPFEFAQNTIRVIVSKDCSTLYAMSTLQRYVKTMKHSWAFEHVIAITMHVVLWRLFFNLFGNYVFRTTVKYWKYVSWEVTIVSEPCTDNYMDIVIAITRNARG